MPIPSGDDIVEVCLRWAQDGQQMINVFHWHGPPGLIPPTLTGARGVASLAFTALTADAAFKAAYSAAVQLQYVTVQLVSPTRYALGRSNNVAGVVGTRAGDPMPTSCQISAQSLCDEAGPGGHGGNRFPGAVATDMVDSLWDTPYIADADAAFKRLYQTPAWLPAGFFPIVYRRRDPDSSNVVKDVQWHTEVRTMKRRVVGRGI